jgi:hypothetical protein
MNLGIFFWTFREHIDAKQLTRNLQNIIPQRISSQIYNNYDARSKQNGLLMIYRIYLKSFTIFNDH